MKNPFGVLFERRSIGSSYDLWSYLTRGVESASGQRVSEQTAMNVAAVYTGVNIRARLLSTLPCRVYERLDERSKRPAVNHPLSRVLSKPNTWQTRAELFAMLEAHRLLRGNAYAWINYIQAQSADGELRPQVAELIPLHPDQVTVKERPDGFGGPVSYEYRTRDGRTLPMTAREVIHLRTLSTDGVYGRSFITDMREVIGGALGTQEHANALWARDATPSVALSHPKTLSSAARKNLEDSWEATYGRGKDKKRVAVLEEGLEIKQLSLTPEDGQFLQTKQDLRAEIAAALMVPPHLMGLADKATSWGSGIEQQQIGLVQLTLNPDVVQWEQRLSADLLQNLERFFIKFGLNGLLRGDSTARGQWYRTMREIGAYSTNDVREFEDLNPVEGGDEYLRPANLTPIGAAPIAGAGAQA